MPSLDIIKRTRGAGTVSTVGQVYKKQSDMIMDATWNTDIDSKIGWFYDMEHDPEFEIIEDFHPEINKGAIPIDIKFFEIEYNSLAKDEVSHHILFKPGFDYRTVVPYYDEKFADPLESHFPIGMYFNVQDSQGIYNRWLVVGEYRYYSNQFPSFLVLPVDHKLQWIYKGKKYECWGCLRSQSS